MKGIVFRLFGVGVVLFHALMLLRIANDVRIGRVSLDAPVITRVSVVTACVLAVGIGLLLLRKWAAVLFSVASASAGLWLIIGSILYVPFPWLFINLGNGLCLFVPALASYFYRQDLG